MQEIKRTRKERKLKERWNFEGAHSLAVKKLEQ